MITSRLRLVRPLGKGGMGEVWVAYHETLGREVAIKLVDVAIARSNPAVLGRFHREAGIAAKLNNPHVAQTYDHGVLGDGTPYIVMERLEGESLAQRIRRGGPLSLYETSLVVSQTAQALGKAHKLGIVHRDVKPGNLFCIDTDYELFIKLLDFGIAKHAGGLDKMELTNTRNMLGSPLYMSPEQFTSAKGVDWRGDLWSLAVVAYRCLTGAPPFLGEALGQVIMAVMNGQYEPITNKRAELPSALNDWFARAFHKDINQRFQSAKELAVSFAQIARNAASQGQPRPRLPSITEMTAGMLEGVDSAAPLPAAPNQPIEPVGPPASAPTEITAELPRAWRASGTHTASVTAPLNGNDAAPPSATSTREPAPIEGAQAATFAPASTTIDERNEGKARLVIILAAAALLVCIGGFAAFIQTGREATPADSETIASSGEPPAEGEGSAETKKLAAKATSAVKAPTDAPEAPSSSSQPTASASTSAESAEPTAATASAKTEPPTKSTAPQRAHHVKPRHRKPRNIADDPGF